SPSVASLRPVKGVVLASSSFSSTSLARSLLPPSSMPSLSFMLQSMSNQPSGRTSLPSVHSLPSTILSAPARSSASSAAAVSDALIAVPHLRALLKHASEQQEVLFTLIKELSDAHPEIKNPEQSAALLGGIKVELPSERERELMQKIAEMRCKVATLVDNVITYRNRNAQLEKQVAAFQQRKEERERQGVVVLRRGR
ncbi:unnamed protein product, partial [Closterium sp. NIES-54]